MRESHKSGLLRPLALILSAAAVLTAADPIQLSSPNKQVQFELSPGMEYSIGLSGKPLIGPSPIAITVDGVNLGGGAQVSRPKAVAGPQGCNGISIPVRSTLRFRVEVRVCNDGVAFRHIVPGAGSRVPDEATVFRLPAGTTVWSHDLEGHYEALHKKQTIGDIAAGEWAAPPVTFQLPGGAGYGSITEAALYRYPGMALQADGKGGFSARLGHSHPPSYPYRLRYKEDIDRVSKPAAIEGPITTPWRVVLIGADLNALVNATLVERLSPPPDKRLFPQGSKTAWVKPGRAVWKYLDGGENTQDTVREFSRLASQLGFEYQVVEGFWQKWPKDELKSVIADSRQQGVGLWLWKHSKELRTAAARKEFFDLCAEVGAAGVKIDFFDHEAKEVVEQYEILLRDAAERKLLVNFHGANKPTGERITWPNELTREGVRGMESRRSDRARHDATLPFTRLLAGPADYTPMHFGERRNDTTWTHQIATAIAFTSPLLTFAAHPKAILDNPAVDLIKSIPATWDQTIALEPSSIGEVAALARRKGNTWFVSVINGDAPRIIRVPLAFLGSQPYQVLAAKDTEGNSGALRLEMPTLGAADTVTVDMPAGGGYVARFVPAAR